MIIRSLSARRAWIEITSDVSDKESLAESLSARRAWIEISIRKRTPAKPFVALRKESVDRNPQRKQFAGIFPASLSARRAWIEIQCPDR